MAQRHTETDILIVGAGLCGLMAATVLTSATNTAQRITIVDKGRSVGGRLATRRIGPGRADHGAQFMTVREASFQRYVDEWLESGLVYVWSNGWGPDFDGYPRYAVRNGFNSLAKELAARLPAQTVNIQTNVHLTQVATGDSDWLATDAAGNRYQAASVVMTSPVPQTLALLDAGEVSLHREDRSALEQLTYAPCLCGLFWVEGDVQFEEPGVALNPDATVSWMADNQRKGISPKAKLITVHAGPEYSEANYEVASEEVLTTLMKSLEPFLDARAAVVEQQLKRWRYAQPLQLHPDRSLKARDLPPLFFGGDVFGGPRVEGASLSGIAIAKEILRSVA